MKTTIVFILMCLTALCQSAESDQASTDAYEGWHLGVQAWSFNRFTFFEAVDKSLYVLFFNGFLLPLLHIF
jgi:hypothetical protein